MQDLIVQRPEGLYCPPGDFYIDPWRRVERAVITHARHDDAHRIAPRDRGGKANKGKGILPVEERIDEKQVEAAIAPRTQPVDMRRQHLRRQPRPLDRGWSGEKSFPAVPGMAIAPTASQRAFSIAS